VRTKSSSLAASTQLPSMSHYPPAGVSGSIDCTIVRLDQRDELRTRSDSLSTSIAHTNSEKVSSAIARASFVSS
jgi:hypothetical protein